MSRILLLGASGQVGAALQPLLAAHHELVTPSRSELDLADGDRLRSYLRRCRPAVIVNAAAYTAVDRAEEEPELARAINAEAPAILAREAEAIGAALVHYSTDYVFDGAKGQPYTEADAPAPLNVYGRTKLAGDQAVMTGTAPYLILRTSWVYGLTGRNFLLTMQRLLGEESDVRVVDDQLGAPTWSRDIARATAQVLAAGADGPVEHIRLHCGLYNLSCGGQTSWHGFAAAIREDALARHGRAAPLVAVSTQEYPTPARRPTSTVLDNRRVHETFHIALPDWRDSLRQALAEQARAQDGGE